MFDVHIAKTMSLGCPVFSKTNGSVCCFVLLDNDWVIWSSKFKLSKFLCADVICLDIILQLVEISQNYGSKFEWPLRGGPRNSNFSAGQTFELEK